MSDITIKQVDELLQKLAVLETEKDEISAVLTLKNKEISSLEFAITEVLESLGREEYDSPHGTAKIAEDLQVKQPSDENKHLLWEWMKAKGIFERYAQVHATSLKSLFKAERVIAIDNGEDPMTFALPGMEPATILRRLKFKAKKVGV